MRITCPNCAAQYEVDASLFPEEGREVQCSTCEHVWLQEPQKAPPLRLDTPSARPSEQLSTQERDALKSAVAEEIEVRSRETGGRFEAPSAGPIEEVADESPDEDAILSALREQIAIEGGDFEAQDGPALSQKRNLKKAAESVGIEVEGGEAGGTDVVSKSGEGSEKKKRRFGGLVGMEKDDPAKTKLAAVLEEYESVAAAERSGHMRAGFLTAIVVCAAGAGLYVGKDSIAGAYPPIGPYLEMFAGYVDIGRDQVASLYEQYGADAIAQITNAASTGEAPAE